MKTRGAWELHIGVALTVVVLSHASATFGQSTGRISGAVTDASGASVPGAKVELFIAGGSSAVSATSTNAEGLYIFPAVQPLLYDVSITASGFSRAMIRQVKVDPGLELSMRPIQMEVATQAELVEVAAEAVTVQTANAEIATTVNNRMLTRFPSLNRSPLAFIGIQAGVGSNGRANSTINGMRPSFTNITVDGVNIQDNFIRTNTLQFQPNMLQLDQVAEFTLSTSNTNASLGNGAAQISFVTPSGTNSLHGNVRWFNRNNAVSANTWFNNRNGVSRPFLNQNQFGGSLGGHLIKDKLFFYGDYEATRLVQQASATRTIFRADARNGIFTYRDTGGGVQRANLLSLFPGLPRSAAMQSILSKIPGPEFINRDDTGDSLNTGGYSFNLRNNRTRDNITGRADYIPSSRHSFSGSYIWNRDIVDRPDLANDYSLIPKVSNDGATNFLSAAHRWSPTAAFTNEARFGFNFAPAIFATSEEFGGRIVTIPLVGNPVNTFRAQGRYSDTYNYSDNATWIKGRHTLSFGLQGMIIHSDPYNDANNLPNYSIGLSTAMAATYNLLPLLPGLRPQDLTAANSLLAFHAGMVSSANQQFNVTSRDSGFVGGAAQARKLRQQNLAVYINDSWKLNRKLTVTLGTRWEYWSPVDEADALVLLPVIPQGGNAISTLLSNTTLDFAGHEVGRPWYKKDWNNLAPNVGLAWQPWGGGKTVIRAGYSINYPNDELIRSIDNNVLTNNGLSQTQNLLNQNNVFIDQPISIPAPAFQVPRLQSANYASSRTSAIGMPDPTLVTPYVQQWNLSVQQEIASGVLEIRYVGNRSTKQFRAFDYNQVVIRENGFLADFDKAFSNLRLSQAAGRGNNAAYNPAIPGSQPLPFFDRLPGGGLLNNATIVNLINTNQPGQLATTYQENGINGAVSFYNNPVALAANMVTNYSNANYNALQIDYSKRFSAGWILQTNYTYSKVMSDSAGDGQTRFEPFLDSQNAGIERSRTPFDLTHSFKLAGAYELPIGKGRRVDISSAFLDAIFGGWGISGINVLRSGAPFSVISGRGTLNRTARSASNTATSTLDKAGLDRILAFRQTGNGPYFADAAVIGPDGRAVAADGAAPFSGQVFFNPGSGTVGALQRRMFDGPRFWNADFQIFKTFKFAERYTADFRTDFFNFTNSPSFNISEQDVNSQNFGRITGTASGRRIIQFGLYLRF
jgi:hypothetical protein